MAATNFTPIILYHTTTASAAPTAGNLNNGELAINITDGKLFYKDNGGTVQVIATKGTGTIGGSNTQVQYNSSGALAGSANFTFNGTTATINTLNLTNALGTAYGGTALTTYTQGDLVYASAANTLAKLGIGANTYILTSTGSVPQWSAPSAVTVATANNLAGGAAGSVPYQSGASTTTFLSIGTAGQVLTSSGSAPQWSNLSSLGVTSLSFGTTGLTPSTATQGAITVAGTLATTNGGTGLTSFTANRVFYASSTSAIGQSANLTFDGTTLTAANFADSSLTSGRVTYATTSGNLTDSANLLYSGTDLTVYGITVGRGAGAVSTNTAMGNTALGGGSQTGADNNAFGSYVLAANTTGYSNVGIGGAGTYTESALRYNTTGFSNTAVGVGSLKTNTSGSYNAAVGRSALQANSTGNFNSAFGMEALVSNTTASNNTAVGYQALYSNTTTSNNTAVGHRAASANTTGDVTAVGYFAALNNTTGSGITAIGINALLSNTTGSQNTAVGTLAGYNNSTGSANTTVGYYAAYSTGNASGITAIGAQAMYIGGGTPNYSTAVGGAALYNTSGANNTGVGHYAMLNNTSGTNNVAMGKDALYSNTTASNNTAVGYQAGYSGSSAYSQYNTFVGWRAGYSSNPQSSLSYGNVCIGAGTGQSLTTGYANTIVGSIGENGGDPAGSSITTGVGNNFIGTMAGNAMTTGSQNTILGSYTGNNSGLDIRTASNYVVLSDGDGNPRGIFNSLGNLWLGATAAVDASGERLLVAYDYPTTGATWKNSSTNNTYAITWNNPNGIVGSVNTDGNEVKYHTAGSGSGGAGAGATLLRAGVQFPANQVASSDANTLDDYEEGTFTPTIATGSASVTYSQQAGNYTKVGRLVTFGLTIVLNTVTSAGSGNFEIGGLPFASSSSDVNQTRLVCQTSSVNFDATAYDFYAYIPSTSVSIFRVLYSYDNGGWAPAQANDFVIAAGSILVITGFYYTNT